MHPPTSTRSRKIQRLLLSLTLAAGALSTLTAENGIRQDELRCEEAKKHLQDCCGASLPDIDCTYVPADCDSTPIYPQLDVNTSVCLRDASCDTLRSSGACSSPTEVSCE